MRAVAYQTPGALDRADALLDVDLPDPGPPQGRDLLVEIRAVSVNPVDTKIRRARPAPEGGWAVLGWDAAGIVTATGPDATLFRPGDAVFYAGALDRPGTNSALHLVDDRLVGPKPATLDWAEAAALPLTGITAWETLFDRLDVGKAVPSAAPTILVIGGAGGVGSMTIQLARALTDLTIIATASRPETTDWCYAMGAHHVIDHTGSIAEQVLTLGLGAPAFVFATTHTDRHLADIATLIAPQGRFAVIDDPAILDIVPFKRKSVSIHWELMFTRSLFATPDMFEQGRLLAEISRLVDAGRLRTTMTERLAPIDAATLRRVHATLESGTARGKIVLESSSSP